MFLWCLVLGIWCFSSGCATSQSSTPYPLYAVMSAYTPETKANELALLGTNARGIRHSD
jgi:hypothetical protein